MLAHLHADKQGISCNTRDCDKLIISLRTSYVSEYSLDKEKTSYSDSLDALRLACKMYPLKDEA